jgi:hypothetical protein
MLGLGNEPAGMGFVGLGVASQPHSCPQLHHCCHVVTLELPLLPNPSVAMIW